jgi:hypothetical protein
VFDGLPLQNWANKDAQVSAQMRMKLTTNAAYKVLALAKVTMKQ